MLREHIVLLGVNHKTAPLKVREQLALSSGYAEPLQQLKQLPSIDESYLLSTCNRVEVLFTCADVGKARRSVLDQLFAGSSLSMEEVEKHIYQHEDGSAVEHLFHVAASLDSMIVGEAQILGQLKEAYRHAAQQNCSGFILNKLLHKSFSVAKRVRTETRIGSSAVSISYAAVELAKKIFGNLSGKKVMLAGAGEMAELAAQHLVGNGVTEVVVANRTLERAVDLARCFHGHAVGLDELLDQLRHVDILISSTGAPSLILHKQDVRSVMRSRRNKPLFFIDIAVPRDLDPAINELDNVYLYDIDDLQNVVDLNRSERDKEALKARRIVEEECLKFARWLDNTQLTPTIVQLRKQMEHLVRCEVEKTMGKSSSQGQISPEGMEKMIAALTSKLIYRPLQYLKNEEIGLPKEGHNITQQDRIRMIRTLFQLDKDQGIGKL